MKSPELDCNQSRLDPREFVKMYKWANEFLSERIGGDIEQFVDEEAALIYHDDLVELYSLLAYDDDSRLRLLAAIGIHNVIADFPQEGHALAARLLADDDPRVVEQTQDTLRDLPALRRG